MCWENSSFLKKKQIMDALYSDIYKSMIISYSVLLTISSVSHTVEKIKTHILCSINFFQKLCRLWDNVKKYCRVRQATAENMTHALCVLEN